jgi:hypothetical protein
LHTGYAGLTNIYNLYTSTDHVTYALAGSGTLVDTYDPIDTIGCDGTSARWLKYEVVGGTHGAHLFEMEAYPVPEPVTMLGMCLGLGSVGAYAKRRRMRRER